jgi:hypothetical protein
MYIHTYICIYVYIYIFTQTGDDDEDMSVSSASRAKNTIPTGLTPSQILANKKIPEPPIFKMNSYDESREYIQTGAKVQYIYIYIYVCICICLLI